MIAATPAETATLVTAIGSLIGVIGLIVKYWWDKRKADRDQDQKDEEIATHAKSIAVTEIEKAIPGFGQMLERYRESEERASLKALECQRRVDELQQELHEDREKCAKDIAALQDQVRELRSALRDARAEIEELRSRG